MFVGSGMYSVADGAEDLALGDLRFNCGPCSLRILAYIKHFGGWIDVIEVESSRVGVVSTLLATSLEFDLIETLPSLSLEPSGVLFPDRTIVIAETGAVNVPPPGRGEEGITRQAPPCLVGR